MTNQEQSNNADFLAKQHQYAREKEKADKILSRYDTALKIVLGFGFGLSAPLLMIVFLLAFSVPLFLFSLVVVGATIGGAIQIRKRKATHQAKLDAQMMDKLKS